jgi:hypothetical protein
MICGCAAFMRVAQPFMIGTHGNPDLLVVHRFPSLREEMNVSVALNDTSHKSTISHASLLRRRRHQRTDEDQVRGGKSTLISEALLAQISVVHRCTWWRSWRGVFCVPSLCTITGHDKK